MKRDDQSKKVNAALDDLFTELKARYFAIEATCLNGRPNDVDVLGMVMKAIFAADEDSDVDKDIVVDREGELAAYYSNILDEEASYPDFAEWESIGVCGLSFASRNLEIVDKYNRVHRHFTYGEAKSLEEKILRPNGWRLPTSEEWRKVKDKHPTTTGDVLKLTKNGWVWPEDIIEWSRDPSAILKITHQCDAGCYWSSTASDDFEAQGLVIPKSIHVCMCGFIEYCGLSIRCVRI